MRDQLRNIIAQVFNVDPSELPDHVTSEDLPAWDSLRHLELMLELEIAFGVEISSEAMPELLSLDAIEAYLRGQVPA
jgi:acyl carrier protein